MISVEINFHDDWSLPSSFPAVLQLVSYVYSQAITSLHVC